MDMFMDKLAQKLTAQEIIKANTTAEEGELKRLRDQVEEYDKCLSRLQQILEESAEKLQGNSTVNEEIRNLLDEKGKQLDSMLNTVSLQSTQLQNLLAQQMENADKNLETRLEEADKGLAARFEETEKGLTARFEETEKGLTARFEEAEKGFAARLEESDKKLDERLEGLDSGITERLAGMTRSLNEKMDQLDGKLDEPAAGGMGEMLDDRLSAVSESIHKECVKVYRNVQAVVVEEGGKQAETLTGAASGVQKIGKKLNIVFGVSLAALLFSLAGAVLQVLGAMGVKLF